MISTQLWWFTARASGIVGWFLLAAGVLWGLALSTKASTTKALKGRVRPNWMLDLHRFLGAAAVVFTAIHVVSLILDSTVHFGLAEVLVPLASAWNPTAVAFGIAAMYLLVAIEATSLLRKHLSKRTWRLVHFASFPLFVFSSSHGLTAGTDGSNPAFVGTVAVTCVAVMAMTAWRIKQALDGRAISATPQRVPSHV